MLTWFVFPAAIFDKIQQTYLRIFELGWSKSLWQMLKILLSINYCVCL